MKQKMRKLLSLLLSLTMVLNMLPLTVWAAMESPDGWLYEVNEDGIAILTGYTGTFADGNVEIPARIDGHAVRIINDDALSEREDVVAVTMTDNIDYIFGGAFKNCVNLEEITISNRLRVLDNVAFYGCTSLRSLELPDSLEEIGENVFVDCNSLQQITYAGSSAQWDRMAGNAGLPAGVEVICTGSDEGLSDDEGWQYYIEEEENRDGIYRYAVLSGNENPVSGDIVIPGSREIDGLDVEAIGAEVFVNNHDLTSVEIREPVRFLFGMAFRNCSNLESVTLPESLRRINGMSFRNCSNLTEIDMSDTEVEFIGEYAFADCTNLENIIFSPDIEEIDEGAFENCTSLTSLVIPESMNEIGENAFSGCDNLKQITYEGALAKWNRMAENAGLPADVEVICTGKEGWVYEIEEDEITITAYNGTFTNDCPEFNNGVLTIPDSFEVDGETYPVLWLGTDSLMEHEEIIEVIVPDTVRGLMGGAFRNCVNMERVTLSDNLHRINSNAFRKCEKLTAIELPASLQYIGSRAFERSGLTTITYHGTQFQWNRLELEEGAIPETVIINCIGQSGWIFGLTDGERDGLAVLMGHTDPLVGEVTLPETDTEGRPVRVIAGEAFIEQEGLTKLIIPDCYWHINPNSFRDCVNLKEIKLPLEVNNINVFAFADCENLEKVLYPGREDQWDEVEVPDNAFMPHDINELIVFGDDGFYELTGTVKTSDGNPIEGATVTLTREDGTVETVTTLDDGIYQFEDLYYESVYQLSAAADGYPTRTVSIQPDADSMYDIIFYTAAEYARDINLAHLREYEIVSFNASIAEEKGDQFVLSNTLEGLTANGKNGTVLPALAESWFHNGDYTEWTFKIRDNAKWVDINGVEKGTVMAEDFATAIEWRLNRVKNVEDSYPCILLEFLAGALEYTDKTERMNYNSAWDLTADSSEFLNTVGVTVNAADNSITFELIKPASNFPAIVAGSEFVSLQPMSEAMIVEIGLHNVNSMDNTDMWYCGPYLLKEFVRGNYKVYEPNPLYWDLIDGNAEDCKLFERVVVTMVGDYHDAYRLFEAGQLDYVEIDGEVANDVVASGSPYADNLVGKVLKPYSYQMHWNYNKYDADKPILDAAGNQQYDYYGDPLYEEDLNWNKAIANEDFRLSLYYGWELSNYYARTNPVDPLLVENYTNTLTGVVYTSDGNDYTELVKERLDLGAYNGESMVRLNQSKAQQHKEAAKEALLALDVTFPIEIDYYVKGDMPESQETLAILRNCLTQSLGDDYVTINICTYEDSLSREVRDPQLQSIAINGWGMDYRDPYNNLFQFAVDENSYYSYNWNNIIDLLNDHEDYAKEVVSQFRTYASMLEEAEQYSGDVRLNKLADAEAYLISHGLVTPASIAVGYCIGYIDPDSMTNSSMKNWEVSDELIGGGEIHDNGIVDMGVWKPQSNHDHVFDWILTDEGTLYITGNGSLEGLGNNGNNPWQPYKNQIIKIVISAGVTGLNETGAFKELEKVSEIEFGEYTEAVPSVTYSLRSVPGMQTRTYSKLETIGDLMFAGCKSLTSITLPEGVVSIGNNAFEGCTSLRSIELPSTIESIGANVFADTSLIEINYNGAQEDWDNIVIDENNAFSSVEISGLDGTISAGNTESASIEIITQPTNAEARLNEMFCATVEAVGDGLKYQWYFRNAGSETWYKSGVKDNTYDDIMTKARNGREIYCVITDVQGNKVTSDTVTLTCLKSADLAIVTQPENQNVVIGGRFNAEVNAVGDGLKYQWRFRNANSDVWSKSSVRDNTYDDVMTKARNGREIYCVITDMWGDSVTTDTVTLTATQDKELKITQQPENAEVKLGEVFSPTIQAEGDEVKYQWYFINAGTDTVRKSGQRDNTYDDVMTKARNGREVYCVVSDMWGNSVESDHVFLLGVPERELAITVQPEDDIVAMDEKYCVAVEAVGDNVKYQWYFQNAGSSAWYKSSVKDNTYDDVMTKARNGRKVYCVITDTLGNTVTTETVTISAK